MQIAVTDKCFVMMVSNILFKSHWENVSKDHRRAMGCVKDKGHKAQNTYTETSH